MSSPTCSSSLLLCILVKSAKIKISDNECYSYVVLKIDNVKSTTNILKGQQPNWEEEFYFDVPNYATGLKIELWEHGELWDKLLGLCYINFNQNDDEYIKNLNNINERWIILDSEFILNEQGEISKTSYPTEHLLLIRTYIQLPLYLTEQESKELTKKLQILHHILKKKGKQLQDVTLDEINLFSTMYIDQQSSLQYQQLTHSHLSDDSDYTSDVSCSINISMSESNQIASSNENSSSKIIIKKPLAFVQPVIRSNSSQLLNSTKQLPMNYDYYQK